MRATPWRSKNPASALRILAVAGLAAALPIGAWAQRGEPNRPRENPSPPAPRRDYNPAPQRDYTPAPRRDYNPAPQRDYTPAPRRDYNPAPQRDYTPAPRRDYNPAPQRDYTPAPRRDYNPAPQRDYTPAPRRDYNPAPQRDYTRGGPLGDRVFPGVRVDGPRNQPPADKAPHLNPETPGVNRGTRDIYDFRRGEPRQAPSIGLPDQNGRSPARDRVPGVRFGQDRQVGVPGRDFQRGPIHDRTSSIFSRTEEGRRYYDNGVVLRPRTYIVDRRIRYYFPVGYVYYPYYSPVFEVGVVASPFYFYYGTCPAYIYRWHVYSYPPPVVYVEVPIYQGDRCRGWGDDDLDDYYLNSHRYRYEVADSELQRAIDDIRDAFRTGDVNPLVNVTDPSVKIAIFLKGRYEYSIAANDYLDMTRDALNAADTITFDLYRVHRRAAGVYVVSGKHVYRNRDGEVHTVYVSYVLERINGRWVITQIGTAPDRIREP